MHFFISYRREDSTHAARLIRKHIEDNFGAGSVFFDRDIPGGETWEDYISTKIDTCSGFIVIMGEIFLDRINSSPKTASHTEKSQENTDIMLWEITQALKSKKPIYPISLLTV